MAEKKNKKELTSQQKKLMDKIHKWAYTDAQKNPKEFNKLFNEIWDSKFKKEH